MAETLRCEWVKCGKENCRTCPHGPYWYGYWREGKRLRKRYVGKGDPRKAGARPENTPTVKVDYRDAIFSDRTAYDGLAFDILGMGITHDMKEITRCYRNKVAKCHPDRGGDSHETSLANAAYHYLRAKYQR